MTYKLKCNDCSHVFVASSRNAQCPRHSSRYGGTNLLEDVAEIAVAAAVAYVAADIVTDVASSVIGGLFDW